MTNKDKMLKMILGNPEIAKRFHYDPNDYRDLYDARNEDNNAVVHTLAMIIEELNGSDDPTVKKNLYTKVFNYLNENYVEYDY